MHITHLPDEVMFGSISSFLDFEELTRVVFLSKHFVAALSHDAVLRSCDRPSRIRGLESISMCLPYSSIYVPSPVRLLRILNRKRCEDCLGELADDQPWMGLFLCSACQTRLSAPIPEGLFQNKGWGCPEMATSMQEGSANMLLERPYRTQVCGKPEFVGPIVTVSGLKTVLKNEKALMSTLMEDPSLLFVRIAWQNTVQTIQNIVGKPPSHYECDVFFRLVQRYACGCDKCLSTKEEDCPTVMQNWEAFFSEG